MKKKLTLVVALVLILVISVGGTLAYLTDSKEVINTFTVGQVMIDLVETDNDDNDDSGMANSYKMIPGTVLVKDPVITVDADSEKCYLFVKVAESANITYTVDGSEATTTKTFADFIEYEVKNVGSGEYAAYTWTKLTGVEGVDNVYYCIVNDTDSDQKLSVIGYTDDGEFVANKVQVKSDVTSEMMAGLAGQTGDANKLTLTITAYAIQYANIGDANATDEVNAVAAWKEVSK